MAGSCLAACVTCATLFKASPVSLKYSADLDLAILKHLQTVAWETVQEYFRPCASAFVRHNSEVALGDLYSSTLHDL